MKLLRNMVHNELQNKALKEALNVFLGNIGSYIISSNRIIYYVNKSEIEDYDKYELRFPSINEIIRRAKTLYTYFEDTKISNICYVFENINFYGNLELTAKSSDVIFEKCKFYDGFMIDEANGIIINNSVCNDSINVKANKLKMLDFGLISGSEKLINIMTKELEIINSSIVCNTANTRVESQKVSILDNSYISSNNLHITASKLNVNNSKLIGKESLEIFTQNNNLVDTVDYDQEDKLMCSKLRIEFIETLKKIKNYKEDSQKQMIKQ